MSLLMSLQAAIMRTRLEMASNVPCRAMDRSTCLEIEKSSRFYKIVERIAAPEIHKFRNKFLLQLKQHFRFSQSLLTLDSITFTLTFYQTLTIITLTCPGPSRQDDTRLRPEVSKITQNDLNLTSFPILNLHFNS